MRTHHFTRLVAVLMLGASYTASAAGFGNLDFEDSPITGGSGFNVSSAERFPSWTVRFGETVQLSGPVNGGVLDADVVALFAGHPSVIQGEHSAYLQAWFTGDGVSLGQVGDVSADSQSLRFLARNPEYNHLPFPPGVFDVRVNGQAVAVVSIWSTGADVLYACDMTPWAGANVDLRIGIVDNFPLDPIGLAVLDSIEFSPLPAPEPGIVGIVSIGVAALGRHSTRREGHFRGSN